MKFTTCSTIAALPLLAAGLITSTSYGQAGAKLRAGAPGAAGDGGGAGGEVAGLPGPTGPCSWDNGQPTTAFPASQDDLVYPFFAEAADDFVLSDPADPGGLNDCEITDVTFWTTIGCNDPAFITGVHVTVYADAGGLPAGMPLAGGGHVNALATQLAPPGNVTFTPFGGDWRIDVTGLSLVVPKNQTLWLACAPQMQFGQCGQNFQYKSDTSQGFPAVQIFEFLGLPWSPLNDGLGDDLAFQITGIKAGGPASPGDTCADCIPVGEGTFAGTTTDNTPSGVATSCAFNDNIDEWYCYTPSCTGIAVASTCDMANYDTTLAVFDACGGNEIACNDDAGGCSGFTSSVAFPVVAGQPVYIRVSGFNDAVGDYSLSITCTPPPANDDCDDAQTVFLGQTPFSTLGATTDGLPHAACNFFGDDQVGSDIWFEYNADYTGQLTVSTCGSLYDTRLAVYDQCNCTLLSGADLLACNDDAEADSGCFGTLQSEVTIPVINGTCYKIRVGGFLGEQGDGWLTLGQTILDCGSSLMGNCFNAQGPGSPGCEDADCCEAVCDVDPFCCNVTWDQSCVDHALDLCAGCGEASSGDCFAGNGTPGCDDDDCCQLICGIDAFCCHVAWDSVCADQAAELCEPPPLPTGACCIANVCNDGFTMADCTNALGVWLGEGTDCGTSVCPPMPEDLNDDGAVDVLDLIIVIMHMGCERPPEYPCPGDANGDGMCDILDLNAVILAWSP